MPLQRIFSIHTTPRGEGVTGTTEDAARELGRKFLDQVTPECLGYDLVVDVSYIDVDGRRLHVRVERPAADGIPVLLGDMHHAATAIAKDGGRSLPTAIAARLNWLTDGRLDHARALTACLAGVDQGIIGVDGDFYTAETDG